MISHSTEFVPDSVLLSCYMSAVHVKISYRTVQSNCRIFSYRVRTFSLWASSVMEAVKKNEIWHKDSLGDEG